MSPLASGRFPSRTDGRAPIRVVSIASNWPVVERALEKWVYRRLGDIEHERRVRRIAESLFDLTRPLHGLGESSRRLLRGGAIVHDVGRCIDRQTHPQQGAKLILQELPIHLSPAARRALAYLTLYHRDAVPEAGKDQLLCAGDDSAVMRLVLGLLRAADALDSRSDQTPRLLLAMNGRRLRISVYLRQPSAKAEKYYRRRKKFRLLRETIGAEVEVQIETEDALSLVA